MFSWIWEKLRSFFAWVIDSVVTPLWNVVRNALTWLVGVIITLVATVLHTLTDLLSDLFSWLITKVTGLFYSGLEQPDWSSINSVLAFANTFFPVNETFAMMGISLTILAIVIFVRVVMYLRKLVPVI